MPCPPFLLVGPPAHRINNVYSQSTSAGTTSDRLGPARTGFGLGLLPRPWALPPSPSGRRVPLAFQVRPSPQDLPTEPRQASQEDPALPVAGTNRMPHPERDPPFREPNSDDFLNELVVRDFSSPSLSPQQRPGASLPAPFGPHLSRQARCLQYSPSGHYGTVLGPPIAPREQPRRSPPPPSKTLPPNAMSSAPRQPSRGDAPASDLELELTEVRSTRPRHGRASQTRSSPPHAPSRKRKRGVAADAQEDRKEIIALDSDDSPFSNDNNQNLQIVDLADADDVPDLTGLCPKKHQVQLRGLQCVICMDDTTNLTVTHCGHLFCGECLHSSLQIDPSRRICPICRQKVDVLTRAAKAKTFYPLRMKLMTAKRHGKKAAR